MRDKQYCESAEFIERLFFLKHCRGWWGKIKAKELREGDIIKIFTNNNNITSNDWFGADEFIVKEVKYDDRLDSYIVIVNDYIEEFEESEDIPSWVGKLDEKSKTKEISIRLPIGVIEDLEELASQCGVNYQLLINKYLIQRIDEEKNK